MKRATTNEKVLMRVTERLPVKLEQDELLDFGQRLAEVDSEIQSHNLHCEAVKKDLKAKETELESKRSRLAGIVRNKAEHRDVECVVLAYFDTNRVRTIREDTGKVVPGSERAMHPDERQESMPLAEMKSPKSKPEAGA